jgi:plastocyanin
LQLLKIFLFTLNCTKVVKTSASILVLLAIISIISISPSAFAEVTITTGPVNLSLPGCEETDECFTPSEVTVDVGEKIIMTNIDTVGIHTFTTYTLKDDFPVPSGIFDSSMLMGENLTFEWTADTVGEIPYYCTLHAWMRGTIIVQEAMAEEEMDDAMNDDTDEAMDDDTDEAMDDDTDEAMDDEMDASDKKGKNASAMGLSKMSPRAQMNQGVESADVQCRDGFELVMKNSNGSAACVKSQSVEKLIQRGWASLI